MSHFVVLVVADKKDERNLADILQPFHEYESTGVRDQYVTEVDITENTRSEYKTAAVNRVKAPDGVLCDKYGKDGDYDPRFLTEEGKFQLPGGWEDVWISPEEAGLSFTQWVTTHRYQDFMVVPEGERIPKETVKNTFVYLDENGEVSRLYRRTNPNAKWDWYVVGGRWSPFFKMKEGATGERGAPGVFHGKHFDDEDKSSWADCAYKKDIDFDAMRKEAGEDAGKSWDLVMSVVGNLDDYVPWKKVRDEMFPGDYPAAREFSHNQRVNLELAKPESVEKIGRIWNIEEYRKSREEYVKQAEDMAACPLAVLKDGVWYERGEMGWWGIVSNEMDLDEWCAKVRELVDGLDDDTVLIAVDCHI